MSSVLGLFLMIMILNIKHSNSFWLKKKYSNNNGQPDWIIYYFYLQNGRVERVWEFLWTDECSLVVLNFNFLPPSFNLATTNNSKQKLS